MDYLLQMQSQQVADFITRFNLTSKFRKLSCVKRQTTYVNEWHWYAVRCRFALPFHPDGLAPLGDDSTITHMLKIVLHSLPESLTKFGILLLFPNFEAHNPMRADPYDQQVKA